ncbi:MAG: zinc-ribbon domain-containing protein, partial [Methanoregula sp.]
MERIAHNYSKECGTMGYTDLYSDESIILETKNVKVKSIPFDAILTTKRLLLVDNKKNVIPQQNIQLATIQKVETGENAIRDSILTLSIGTETGKTRQMILTFSRQTGERKRECDDFAALLKERIALMQPKEEKPAEPAPEVASAQKYGTPAPSSIGVASTSGKKKIEISRPIKKIIEKSPVYPQPIETTSLPQGSFCPRCGNRIPPESTFCNRCGTRVPAQSTKPAEPEKVLGTIRDPIPAMSAPVFERKERPIEQIIHSIEPLIEDSVPRAGSRPIVPEPVREPLPFAPVPETSPVPDGQQETISPSAIELAAASIINAANEGSVTPAEPAPAAQPGTPPQTPLPPVPSPPSTRKPRRMAIIGIAIVILLVIGGIVIYSQSLQKHPDSTNVTIVPTGTTVATTIPTPTPHPTQATITTTVATAQPTLLIPQSGIWIKISYPQTFTGTYGTPGAQTP